MTGRHATVRMLISVGMLMQAEWHFNGQGEKKEPRETWFDFCIGPYRIPGFGKVKWLKIEELGGGGG